MMWLAKTSKKKPLKHFLFQNLFYLMLMYACMYECLNDANEKKCKAKVLSEGMLSTWDVLKYE